MPPLVDADDDGDEARSATVTEIGSASLPGVESDAEDRDAPGAPVLTIVSDQGAWVPPLENGDCPDGYPVKVNHQSGIFHVPGGRSYNRTAPQRCYATADAAAADGYRAAKA